MLGLDVRPTSDTYSVVGNAKQVPFLGVCYNVPIRLSERLEVPTNLYVVPGDSVILLANDVFNSECANIVAVVAQHSYYIVQYGSVVDLVPFEKLTPTERGAAQAARVGSTIVPVRKQVAPARASVSDTASMDSFENFIEAHVARQIALTSVPENAACYMSVGGQAEVDESIEEWAKMGFLGL